MKHFHKPTKYALAINLKTAKALGLDVHQHISLERPRMCGLFLFVARLWGRVHELPARTRVCSTPWQPQDQALISGVVAGAADLGYRDVVNDCELSCLRCHGSAARSRGALHSQIPLCRSKAQCSSACCRAIAFVNRIKSALCFRARGPGVLGLSKSVLRFSLGTRAEGGEHLKT
jgi:hypothetical protein